MSILFLNYFFLRPVNVIYQREISIKFHGVSNRKESTEKGRNYTGGHGILFSHTAYPKENSLMHKYRVNDRPDRNRITHRSKLNDHFITHRRSSGHSSIPFFSFINYHGDLLHNISFFPLGHTALTTFNCV